MRLFILLFFSIFFFSLQVNAKDIKIVDGDNRFNVINCSFSEFTIISQLSEFNIIKINSPIGDFAKLMVPGYGENAISGNAELPVLEKLINVPLGSDIFVEVLNIEEEIISLSDYGVNELIFPSQPSLSKGDNAQDVPFYFTHDYYNHNDFHELEIFKTELLGKMRGVQLGRISLSPFQYNPNTNKLKIITKIEIKVIFKNIDFEVNQKSRTKYYSHDFEQLYRKTINYVDSGFSKDMITTYPIKYVIISDPSFQSALQPLVEWKTKKGFIVVEAYTNDPAVGNTTSSIHAFIKNMYDNATSLDPAPTYLLIVGDDSVIPSFNTGQHLSDMYYCEFDGNGDFYPEMYYGRFSASSLVDVEAQVYKTLMHEKYIFPDPSFLDEVVLVAGVDASMAPTYGNGQINYGTDHYFNTTHGLTIHNYLYGSGTPITSDDPSASAEIISNISSGVGFANYTAHCGSSGWSDPSFDVSDVSALQNVDKFGVLVGNCCQSNKFDVDVCFGEALLRADDRGAVGYIGGSNNTYWNEDFWWAVGNGSISVNPTYAGTELGVYDCLMHENGEQQSDWFITQGQMIHSGNLAVTQAGGSEQYYWEIYHVMGDPSLMPYIGVPIPLTVSHNAVTTLGSTSFTVNTEENAYVAISMNGVLLDAKLADMTGIVNLSFPSISNIGVLDIVITKQFRQPYIGNVQVISPTGPYVMCSNNIISDPTGNNNSLIDYGEAIELNIDLDNIGSSDATSLNVIISTSDPYITIINSSLNIPLISASQTLTTTTPFSFQVESFVPDQHIVFFDIEITDSLGNVWNSTTNVLINAPILNHTNFIIDDSSTGNSNGRLDAGETLDLIVNVTNIGHADVTNLTAYLNSLSTYISVNSSTSNITSLNVNQNQSAIFNISINSNTPVGTYADFSFNLTDGLYSYNHTFNDIIGIIDEDYETGDFTQYAWDNDVDYPWTIDSVNIYEGQNSSKSGTVPHSAVSNLKINLNVIVPGDISFYKFVSSEEDYDFLQFYIDGDKQGEWSGIDNSWSFVSFPVAAGLHEFEWEYDKDGGWSEGQDCAWIDYIVFPPIDLGQANIVSQTEFLFDLYPNPNIGVFNLLFNDNKVHRLDIFNIRGEVILSLDNQEKLSIFDIREYAPGTYTLRILPEGITYQIIKQ